MILAGRSCFQHPCYAMLVFEKKEEIRNRNTSTVGKILLSVLLAVAFIVFSGIKPIYANILFEKKEGI